MDNKKKVCFLLFGLLASLWVSSLACSSTAEEKLVYDESYSGKEVVVSLNDSFELTLGATGSYYWYEDCTIDDESVIKQTGYDYQPAVSAILVTGNQVWTFEAVGKGTTTISNIYGGIHGNNQSFELSVVVE